MAFPWFSWKARPIPLAAVHDALSAVPCVVAAGRPLPDVRKLDGVSPRMLARTVGGAAEALFLVEADGAARKPLKAPAAHEPVLPEPLGCCVAVVGLDSVGQPLDDGHVHRSALVCAAAGQEPGSPVTPATLACLVEHPEGLFRNCPAGCRRLVFANKGDGRGRLMPLPKPPPCLVPWRGLREARPRAGASR